MLFKIRVVLFPINEIIHITIETAIATVIMLERRITVKTENKAPIEAAKIEAPVLNLIFNKYAVMYKARKSIEKSIKNKTSAYTVCSKL